jgi:uncharacterized membrane protein YkvA (DUF1232 family)
MANYKPRPKDPAEQHPELARYFANPWPGGVPPQEDAHPLHGYVANGARLVNAAARRALRQSEARLRIKAIELRSSGRVAEANCVQFLLRFLAASRSAGPRSAALCRCVNEAGFALLYVLADEDLVPDDLPGVGYSDDAAVLAAVIARNALVLRDFAQHIGIDWDTVQPSPASQTAE